jgi:hypothetical protein
MLIKIAEDKDGTVLYGRQWSKEFIRGLPDSAFAVEYDGQNLFPHHNKDGSVSLAQLRNCWTTLNKMKKDKMVLKAKAHIINHMRENGLDLDTETEIIADVPEDEATADFTTDKYVHVGVIENTKQFNQIRTIQIKPGIKARVGIKNSGGKKTSTVINYLFDKNSWDLKKAKAWVKSHRGGHAKGEEIDALMTCRLMKYKDGEILVMDDGDVFISKNLEEEKESIMAGLENGTLETTGVDTENIDWDALEDDENASS